MKLDLGCGENKREGFVGVDIVPGAQVDIVLDLEKYPWEQFPDSSVDEICSSHYVEHVGDLVAFMDEVWRIAKPGALITWVAPYYSSMRAMQDPTHKNFISENTWNYFSRDWRVESKMGHYPIQSNFEVRKNVFFYEPPWDAKSPEEQAFARKHYLNVVQNIYTELVVIKD